MARDTGRGFFRGAMDALIEARARQASRYVNGALLMLDDKTLADNGFNREDLRRKGGASYFI